MTVTEVIELLAGEGYRLSRGRLQHMVDRGYVDRPPMPGNAVYIYGKRHIDQIRRYLEDPPRPGRKPRRRVATAG